MIEMEQAKDVQIASSYQGKEWRGQHTRALEWQARFAIELNKGSCRLQWHGLEGLALLLLLLLLR